MKTTIVLACLLLCGCRHQRPPAPVTDCSKAEQDERKELVEGLIKTKLVKRFENDGPTRMQMWATPSLLSRDFDAKSGVCRVSFDYFACQSKGFKKVVLIDSRTGKEIGQYTKDSGLQLD